MKALHQLRKYNPAEWGGTETVILQPRGGLRNEGWESVVYAPKIDDDVSEHDPLADAGFIVKRFRAVVPVWGIANAQRKQLVSIGGNLMSFDVLWKLWREPGVQEAGLEGRVIPTGGVLPRDPRLVGALQCLLIQHSYDYLSLAEVEVQGLKLPPFFGQWLSKDLAA